MRAVEGMKRVLAPGTSRRKTSRPRSRQKTTLLEPSWAELLNAFELAEAFDSTVAIKSAYVPHLLRRHVAAIPYSRSSLFAEMLAGRPVVFTGFPAPLREPLIDRPPSEAGFALASWFAQQRNPMRHKVFVGPTGVRRHLRLDEIARKWRANQTRFGVTDLHIRGTRMEEVINPDVLSSFNLLPQSTAGAREREMFSFVISTRGHVTDSHSDDPDSSNYCFIGRKLWLAWDTYEGAARGLQDVERVPLAGKARFDLKTWLSMRSARWCTVSSGETLFLPGHLTHKVITLEPYIGVGGFFIALPNCLRLLAHWIIRGPLWSKRDSSGERDPLIGEIANSVRDAILDLRKASRSRREQWGCDHFNLSARAFIESCPAHQLYVLLSDPRFRAVADLSHAPWPVGGGERPSRARSKERNIQLAKAI